MMGRFLLKRPTNEKITFGYRMAPLNEKADSLLNCLLYSYS